MKLFKKTYLSTALTAALVCGGAPGIVGAVTLSQDNIGDATAVPYYTMRGGWATDFSITNTSGSTVAAKIRFHEARNSREVLDFTVVLSPHDQINAYAYYDAVLGPIVRFPAGNSENTCVVPIPQDRVPANNGVGGYLPFSASEYTGPNWDLYGQRDGGPDPLDRTMEGYFTVIEMGSTSDPNGTVAAAALHSPEPNCDVVDDAFREENIVATYNEFERNLNALKVSYGMVQPARGVQGQNAATMFANFATWDSAIAHTQTSIQAGGVEVVAAQAAVVAAEAAVLAAYNALDATADALDLLAPGCFAVRPTLGDPWPANPCAGFNAVLDARYTAEVAAYNTALVTLADAVAVRNDALVAQLGAPRNLIHAQEGAVGSGDPERFPNLNSGDFFAYWLVDSEYKDTARFNPATGAETCAAGTDPTPCNYDRKPEGLNPPFGLWFGLYPRPVDAITALLMRSDAINHWAYNANTGASTDLVLTAPTKRFYTDWETVYANDPHLTGISPILAAAVANIDFGWPPFGEQFIEGPGQSCDQVGIGFYNNDELGPIDPTLPSPTATSYLCWETNVLYTGAASVLESEVAEQLDVRNLLATSVENETYNGWVNVNMAANAYNYHPAIPLLNITLPNGPAGWPIDEIVQLGMPYMGFQFSERDLGNPANAYGGMSDHSYLRNWDKRNLVGGTLTTDDLPTLLTLPVWMGSWFATNPITPIINP